MIFSRFKTIFTLEELNRISICEFSNDLTNVKVDVHGLKCNQAKRFINNIINLARSAFRLTIIHGYRHGTAIKEMLASNFENDHVLRRFSDTYNQGITHMLIAAY